MSAPPVGKDVGCPECTGTATAIVPHGSKIVTEEESADGKVWVYCRNCDHQFLAYYRLD